MTFMIGSVLPHCGLIENAHSMLPLATDTIFSRAPEALGFKRLWSRLTYRSHHVANAKRVVDLRSRHG